MRKHYFTDFCNLSDFYADALPVQLIFQTDRNTDRARSYLFCVNFVIPAISIFLEVLL